MKVLERKKEILYLTYDGLSDPLGQSQVIPYMIGLTGKGYKITIVSTEKKGNENYLLEIRKVLDEAGIDWYKIHYTKRPVVLSTLFDIVKMFLVCRKLFRKKQFDIIHCRSYIMALLGYRLKRLYKSKFIFDMRGFFADERIDGGMWDQNSLLYRLVYRFFKNEERKFLESADFVVCITKEALKEMNSWISIKRQTIPIEVIPCCTDFSLFDRSQFSAKTKSELKNQLGISEFNPVISYVGAVGTWYMLPEMLGFFKRLLLKYPSACFLFITHENPQMIRKLAKLQELPDSNIIIHKARHSEVPLYLSLSDLSIFFIKPLYSKSGSSPAKQGEIMSMGIPIICNSNVGDTDRIIRESNAGAIVRTFTNENYDYLVEKIPELLSLSPDSIRSAAKNIYSLEIGVEKYASVYEKVLYS